MNFPSQMLANIETAIARLDPHAPDYAAQRASLEGMASEHRADMARCWGDTNPLARMYSRWPVSFRVQP